MRRKNVRISQREKKSLDGGGRRRNVDFEMKIKMGAPVVDVVTGFKGIVSAYSKFMTGCDQVAIKTRDLDKDGKIKDSIWVDVTRVRVLGEPDEEIAAIVAGKMVTGEQEKPGGPQETPPER